MLEVILRLLHIFGGTFTTESFFWSTRITSWSYAFIDIGFLIYKLSFFLLVRPPWSESLFIIGCYYSNPRTAATRSLGSVLIDYLASLYSHSQRSALAPLHSAPLETLAPLDVLLSSSFFSGSVCTTTSASDSDSDSVSAACAFDVSQSIPFCSHHFLDTLVPPLCVVCSQRSRSGRVAIYCATVFI